MSTFLSILTTLHDAEWTIVSVTLNLESGANPIVLGLRDVRGHKSNVRLSLHTRFFEHYKGVLYEKTATCIVRILREEGPHKVRFVRDNWDQSVILEVHIVRIDT